MICYVCARSFQEINGAALDESSSVKAETKGTEAGKEKQVSVKTSLKLMREAKQKFGMIIDLCCSHAITSRTACRARATNCS